MKKKGSTLLTENVIFIILNVVFIAILVVFLVSKINNVSTMQEKYAKEIALSLDSAMPGMIITMNMSDAMDAAKKNLGEKNLNETVNIQGNMVTVKLQDGKGYSYSFFNDLNMSKPVSNYYFDKKNNAWVFFVGGYRG